MGDVVRHSRPDRQAPHAAAGRLVLEHADDPGRALVRAGVQAESVLQVRVVRRGRHRDRPAVRDVGEQGAEGHDGGHAQALGGVQHLGAEPAPPHGRFDAMDERDDLTGAGAGRRGDRRARPRDNPTTVFADADGRTAHLEVVVLLRVQLGDLPGRPHLLEVDQRLGGAATQALIHLQEVWAAEQVAELDPEEYHDFQVSRPTVGVGEDGRRVIAWPSTSVTAATRPGSGEVVALVHGIEPSMRWRRFCSEVLDTAERLGVTTVVTLGALLADVPHSRPIPVTATSDDPDLQDALGLDASTYEGPTGIGRLCGTSASRAPRVTTVVTPRRSAVSSTSEQNRRHRMDGSMPWTSATTSPEPGRVAAVTDVLGHAITRRPSSPTPTVGRLTWKSWYSSGSSSATCSAAHTSWRWISAWVAAPPASFQPSKAASMTGPRRGATKASVMTPA